MNLMNKRCASVAATATLLLATKSLAETVVSPDDFGAFGDGSIDDNAAIVSALEACAGVEDCVVQFTAGKTYLTGPFSINHALELRISGDIQMLDRDTYLAQYGEITFISADGISGVTITSDGGTVDLGGEPWWPCKETGCFRPTAFEFSNMQGLRIQGLHAINAPNHFLKSVECTGTRVENILLEAPHDSPNTDGINFYGGSDQSILNSHISNGDDCVSVIVVDRDECVDDPTLCQGGNVLVENMLCEGGHGASIGSVRHGTVTNATFRNITLTGEPTSTQEVNAGGGARIKTYPNGTGTISGIVFEDINVKGSMYPVQLLGLYCPPSQTPYPCPEGSTAIKIFNVTFKNVRGYGGQDMVGDFNCGTVESCYGISLEDIALMGLPSSAVDPYFNCSNAYGKAAAVSPEPCLLAPP